MGDIAHEETDFMVHGLWCYAIHEQGRTRRRCTARTLLVDMGLGMDLRHDNEMVHHRVRELAHGLFPHLPTVFPLLGPSITGFMARSSCFRYLIKVV